jgi:hypothetical protein
MRGILERFAQSNQVRCTKERRLGQRPNFNARLPPSPRLRRAKKNRLVFSAKGAAFNVEPGATPQDSREDKRER